MVQDFQMSFFQPPITNKIPSRTVSLMEVAQMVKSTWLEPQTLALRKIADEVEARRYKGYNYPYVTPAGVFSYCSDQSLVNPTLTS